MVRRRAKIGKCVGVKGVRGVVGLAVWLVAGLGVERERERESGQSGSSDGRLFFAPHHHLWTFYTSLSLSLTVSPFLLTTWTCKSARVHLPPLREMVTALPPPPLPLPKQTHTAEMDASPRPALKRALQTPDASYVTNPTYSPSKRRSPTAEFSPPLSSPMPSAQQPKPVKSALANRSTQSAALAALKSATDGYSQRMYLAYINNALAEKAKVRHPSFLSLTLFAIRCDPNLLSHFARATKRHTSSSLLSFTSLHQDQDQLFRPTPPPLSSGPGSLPSLMSCRP